MGKRKVSINKRNNGKTQTDRKVPLGGGMLKKTGTTIKERRKKQADILKELGF